MFFHLLFSLKTLYYSFEKYLIVIDVQKDFVDGALGTKEAVVIIPRVKEKVAQSFAVGDKIILQGTPIDLHLS